MIKQIKKSSLTIALVIVVALSAVLSASVWINPFHYERGSGDSTSTSARQDTVQSLSDIYKPTEVIRTYQDRSQKLLYDQAKNPVMVIEQQVRKWKLKHLTRVVNNDSAAYLRDLRTENSIMISYPDAVATTVFNQTFNQSVDTARLKRINHIVITLDKTPTVYLMADEKYQVYRLTTTSQSLAVIKKSLVGGSQLNVDHKIVNGIPLTTFPHQISMPTYRSTINHQNLDSIAQTLMASSSVSTVSSQTTSKLITYTAGNSRRMTYNKGTGQVQYDNYLGKDNSYGTQTLYTHLFDLLADTAVPLEQVQYDNVSLVGQTITYRSFVEGFPIFSDNDYGTVRIKANNDGVERYHLSPLSLGIPLPASGQKVTLPSTVTVLNALYQAGKGKDIKGLRLGYTWATNQNKSLVTLSPTYYVYYHGNWVKYQSLLKGD